jgi:hypothetical protein
MNIVDLLQQERSGVLGEASARLQRSDAQHYQRAGEAFTQESLAELFDVVVASVRGRRLTPVGAFCEEVARRRFEAGFGIAEVQTAFNTLERLMWERVVSGVPSTELAEDLGLLSTAFGFGKDALTRRWVLLTSQQRAPQVGLSAAPA